MARGATNRRIELPLSSFRDDASGWLGEKQERWSTLLLFLEAHQSQFDWLPSIKTTSISKTVSNFHLTSDLFSILLHALHRSSPSLSTYLPISLLLPLITLCTANVDPHNLIHKTRKSHTWKSLSFLAWAMCVVFGFLSWENTSIEKCEQDKRLQGCKMCERERWTNQQRTKGDLFRTKVRK